MAGGAGADLSAFLGSPADMPDAPPPDAPPPPPAPGDAIDKAAEMDPGKKAALLKRIGDAKAAAIASFARSVRALVANYVALHRAFVTQRHGEALKYVQYWSSLPKSLLPGRDVEVALQEYDKAFKAVVATATDTLLKKVVAVVRADAYKVVSSGSGAVGMTDKQVYEAMVRLDRLVAFVRDQAEGVGELYLRGGVTLLEEVGSPHVLLLYAMKAAHVAVAWYATRFAERAFASRYRRSTYAEDNAPPSPVLYVLLALALDLGAHAALGVGLLVARKLFKSDDNAFPVDEAFLALWAVDAALVVLAVGVLSLLLAEVVQSKKYFRYKYEGERGLRALRDMMFYVYCVMAPVPFYRVLHG
jgi:hypothetical protein